MAGVVALLSKSGVVPPARSNSIDRLMSATAFPQSIFIDGGKAPITHQDAATGDHVARLVRGRAKNQVGLRPLVIQLRQRIIVEYDEIGRRSVRDGSRARLGGGQPGDTMADAGRKLEYRDGGGPNPGIDGPEPRQHDRELDRLPWILRIVARRAISAEGNGDARG
jgi:hypothetical protein